MPGLGSVEVMFPLGKDHKGTSRPITELHIVIQTKWEVNRVLQD